MPVITHAGRNLLFIHVPKTGGTSVEILMGKRSLALFDSKNRLPFPCSPQHFHAEILQILFPKHFFHTSFMLVRDPYDRIKSEYRMRRGRFRGKALRFQDWLERVFAAYLKNPYILDNHVRPQCEFLAFDAKVFRLEDGLEPIAQLVADFKQEPERPVRRALAGPPIQIDETEACRAMTARFYAEDYRTFGYATDDALVA